MIWAFVAFAATYGLLSIGERITKRHRPRAVGLLEDRDRREEIRRVQAAGSPEVRRAKLFDYARCVELCATCRRDVRICITDRRHSPECPFAGWL